MNLRTSVAAVTLCLGSLASLPAFAQSAPCHTGGLPVAQPVVGQPVYQQPVYQQPVYPQPVATTVVLQPAYGRPMGAGYAQPGYAQPGYARPGFGPRRAMMQFVNGLQARLAQADRQVRVGVARGAVAPQAIQAFAAQRAQLEGALAQVTQDGYLAPQEQSMLDQMTARLESLDAQYRLPVAAPVAYNGNGYGNGYGHGRRWR
jgi:hypothetical protein